jgi:hypothetical protein
MKGLDPLTSSPEMTAADGRPKCHDIAMDGSPFSSAKKMPPSSYLNLFDSQKTRLFLDADAKQIFPEIFGVEEKID